MLVNDEGTPVSNVTISYDVERPEELDKFLGIIDEKQNEQSATKRTLKLIYDYDTPQEQVYEVQANDNYKVITNIRNGYNGLYKDPEKTEVYEGDNTTGDVTIYAFSEE